MRILALVFLMVGLVAAQQSATQPVTADDYARAERFLSAGMTPLLTGVMSRATWLPNGRLSYRVATDDGSVAFEMDPATGKSSKKGGAPRRSGRGSRRGRRSGNAIPSPDGKRAAFIRKHNLWVRDTVSGEETQLTTDGIEHFGYATNNAGWTKRDSPVLLWSPDSSKIATFQHDGRGVGDMYLVTTEVGHPKLQAWKYPLPGDEHIFRIQRVVIHVDAKRVVRLEMAPDPHRSTTTDHIAGRGGEFLDVEWSLDSSQLAFVSSSRDHKVAQLRVADPETGKVRDVLKESVATYFESGARMRNWHVLFETNEVLWFSERDDWGHLYLYDLTTGELKHRVTSGPWPVLQVRGIDRDKRRIYFTASRPETDGANPYHQRFCRIGIDGKGFEVLTPGPEHFDIVLRPDFKYFVSTASSAITAPISVLRAVEGGAVTQLSKGDTSKLQAAGWVAPRPFKVKARDGKTNLYGLLYRPTGLDPGKRYPVLNYIYPGPQSGSVGSRAFRAARSDKQALAELGFVVVEVDAMGTPGRSKSFHDAYYGNMGDNGLPDQIATIKQLAAMRPWMDLERVGVWGHSGGGFASTGAILRYPDFYKVAVSGAGNHDNRNYEDDWGEKWQGLLTEGPNGETNYDNQASQLLAKNLKGKLLLAHGTLDSNVPPSNTMLVVNALIAANKDFDLLLFPNRGHGFGREPYMMRRRWDYFVRHLQGVEPPKEYQFGLSAAVTASSRIHIRMRYTALRFTLVLLIASALVVAQRRGSGGYVREHYDKQERMIEMRDGKKLFTAIYTPKDASKPYPIMMVRSPYSSGPYGEDKFRRRLGPSALFMEAGFIFVYQDVRGKYLSEGTFVPVRPHNPNKKRKEIDESSDTYDTIDWLIKNVPNNNGRVGTWGISAPGFYATHTTIDAHPALKAASPQAPVTDWWLGDDRHHNGALMLQASFSFVPSYGAVRPKPSTRGMPGFRGYNSQDGYRWYLEQGPLPTFNEKYLHHENPLWNDLMEHEDYDSWWQARTPLPHLGKVTAATLTVGGFFDAQDLYGPLKTYGAYRKRNPRGQHHLVMGPWSHGGWSRGDGDRYNAINFEKKTGPFYREKIEFPFFEHHLKGSGREKLDLPEATVFVSGSNEWHTFDQWPPRQATPAKLYVHADGVTSFDKPTGKGGYDEYVSDPDKPVPHTPKIVIRRDDRYVVQDQRFAASRPDVLVYESPPLTEDVTVIGELFAHLYVTTTGTDADFIVKLIDVYPNEARYQGPNPANVKMGGFQFMVRGDIMRAKYRNSFEHPEAMTPGKVTRVRFDLQDVAHTFLKGHRIMVQIQSTWFPLANRNPQVFTKQYKAKADVYQKATHRVYATPRHPSHLELSILKAR